MATGCMGTFSIARLRFAATLAGGLALGGCGGTQSAFSPFGAGAESSLTLAWGMWIAAGLILSSALLAAMSLPCCSRSCCWSRSP